MSGHAGRCFRAFRRTKLRYAKSGRKWERPIRVKVPLGLRGFLNSGRRATQAGFAEAVFRSQPIPGAGNHAIRRGGARGR
jgi:hypothetical protein